MENKYWILYRDHGYGEKCIYGVTMRATMAKAWCTENGENETAECELTCDSLPTHWID